MPEWAEIVLRAGILFVLLLLAVPLIGRKPLSGMTMFDHIVGIVFAAMSALIILKVVPNMMLGLLGLLIWFIATLIVQWLVQKSKWAHDHLYGKEVVVIKEGKVLEENLQSARLTGEELLSQLRRKNIFQVTDVEFAVMEANGDITALLKRDRQPLTAVDMGLKTNLYAEPATVILDGKLLDEPLTTRGLNRDWLMNELEKIGVSAENVFIAQVDSMGELYVDLFDDAIQLPKPSTKGLLLAALKKAEADFLSYALETENEEWKKKYGAFAQQLKEMNQRLDPYLRS